MTQSKDQERFYGNWLVQKIDIDSEMQQSYMDMQ
jgi:hypothetical protein